MKLNKGEPRSIQSTIGGERQPDSSNPSGHSLNNADCALRSGRYREAAEIAGSIVAKDPGHVGALETLAKAQWQSGEYRKLLGTLASLTRLNPYEPGYHALKGAALQCLGRYGESVRAYVRGGDTQGSKQASEELRGWQATLVKDLLIDDPVFRAHYARNPGEACESRGFELGSESTIRDWFMSNDSVRSNFLRRPS